MHLGLILAELPGTCLSASAFRHSAPCLVGDDALLLLLSEFAVERWVMLYERSAADTSTPLPSCFIMTGPCDSLGQI